MPFLRTTIVVIDDEAAWASALSASIAGFTNGTETRVVTFTDDWTARQFVSAHSSEILGYVRDLNLASASPDQLPHGVQFLNDVVSRLTPWARTLIVSGTNAPETMRILMTNHAIDFIFRHQIGDLEFERALTWLLAGRPTLPPTRDLAGLTADDTGSAESRYVATLIATPAVLGLLRTDERALLSLTSEEFELFLCNRLEQMEFAAIRVGTTYARDGGVDIVACPRYATPFPFLIAVQAKHHRDAVYKTGPDAVKELQAVTAAGPFQGALLVTNTTFTPDAQWFASSRPHLVRLRDITTVRRWIWDDFASEADWREVPIKGSSPDRVGEFGRKLRVR